jgi:hypothetical protein
VSALIDNRGIFVILVIPCVTLKDFEDEVVEHYFSNMPPECHIPVIKTEEVSILKFFKKI